MRANRSPRDMLSVGEEVCHVPTGTVGKLVASRRGFVWIAAYDDPGTKWVRAAECVRLAH